MKAFDGPHQLLLVANWKQLALDTGLHSGSLPEASGPTLRSDDGVAPDESRSLSRQSEGSASQSGSSVLESESSGIEFGGSATPTKESDPAPGYFEGDFASLVNRFGETWAKLVVTARPARAQRLGTEQMREIVIQLCEIMPLSLTLLWILLNRSQGHVSKIVRGLVAEGRLLRWPPDQGQHAEHTYTAVKPVGTTSDTNDGGFR